MAIFPTAFSLRGATQRSALLTKDRHLAATVNGTVSVLLVPGDGLDDAARICAALLQMNYQGPTGFHLDCEVTWTLALMLCAWLVAPRFARYFRNRNRRPATMFGR